MSDNDEITVEDALQLIAEGEDVHTLMRSGSGVLLGAGWARARVIEAIRGAELVVRSGPVASSTGHGIAIQMDGDWLFIATKRERLWRPTTAI